MKCLSVLEPFALCISRGIKRVENRTWSTSYRVPLLIHAGQSRRLMDTLTREQADQLLGYCREHGIKYQNQLNAMLGFGCVVGVADLFDVDASLLPEIGS